MDSSIGGLCWILILSLHGFFLLEVSAKPDGLQYLKNITSEIEIETADAVSMSDYVLRVVNFLWQSNESGYEHVWPVRTT